MGNIMTRAYCPVCGGRVQSAADETSVVLVCIGTAGDDVSCGWGEMRDLGESVDLLRQAS